jgi:hypothetical protein
MLKNYFLNKCMCCIEGRVFGFFLFGLVLEVLVLKIRAALHILRLYFLSHNSDPFCSGYFGGRVLLFAHAVLECNPPFFDCLS